MISRLVLSGCLVVGCVGAALGQESYFDNWPKGVAPAEVGKNLAEHFLTSPTQYTKTVFYAETGTWYGALQFAELTHDDALRQKLVARLDPMLPGGATPERVPHAHHVDAAIFGVVPLEVGRQLKDPKYVEFGRTFADDQWKSPDANGLSDETRFWIDDMYMLTMLQLEAYRAPGARKYLDRDAKEMV